MIPTRVNTVVVGAGQAGLAMSAHLRDHQIDHVVLERDSIAERWRNARWDSLVMNGPAWHDRFPARNFDSDPDGFPGKDEVTRYFEDFAKQIEAPIHCGVEVTGTTARPDGGYQVETSAGSIHADHVVAATGPFQIPVIPAIVPDGVISQLHSFDYHNPEQLQDGAVLVVGAGSSGAQIADELLRSGRKVYLSIGPHERPPRSYRGKDFVWWVGTLGKWQMKTPPAGKEHVTIAVSGAYGGATVDFRKLADRGMELLGMTGAYDRGVISIADDLAKNIADGDANYLGLLAEADAYIEAHGLDLPPEEDAKIIGPDPDCMKTPIRQIDLAKQGINTIIWATGYVQDFSWLKVDAFDADGKPLHDRGVAKADGIYFLGLPWLSMRGSSFIWGVWEDAKYLAAQISARS
ncbi:MAG: flavin-containing monooxygenase [Candidatus Puniceispirillaceae bacterium]